jgi:uncharacterized protein
MSRNLTADDLDAALVGGLLLSAGGSGRRSAARARELGRMALESGDIRFSSLGELNSDDPIITATAIGAPGVADPAVMPRDSVEAARRLVAMLDKPPRGVICGHVPGFNAWLVAATLGLDYVDAASNGRGHPTVKMGGMGLASRPDISIIQVAASGGEAGHAPLNVVAEGDIVRTSNVMRQAAVVNGGLIYAARGPLTAGFIAENGAAGAITFQLELGRAMLRADAPARVEAAVEFLGGRLLSGAVTSNTVAYSNGFDLGQMIVRGSSGEIALGIYNEYMTADIDGQRVATFPDMIGTLDPRTGDPVAISELPHGSEVAVIIAHRSKFPVGKGALDPAVFPEVEKAMGVDLRSYL